MVVTKGCVKINLTRLLECDIRVVRLNCDKSTTGGTSYTLGRDYDTCPDNLKTYSFRMEEGWNDV